MQKVNKATRPQAVTGIALMAAGIACLTVSDATGKALTAGYTPIQILFIRYLVALPIAVLIALRMGGRAALRSQKPAIHLARGAILLVAATLFFTGLSKLGLAEATALVFAAPVFITALSAFALGEHVGWRRWTAVLVGFAGVLIIVRPGGAAFQAASLYPVATAFFYAMLMISARFVDPRETVWTLMLYMTGAGALLSLPVMPFVWTAVRVDDWWLFAAIALFGTAGITMITQAFRLAPAAVVAPFDYTALIWATLIGWLVWGEIPDAVTYLGAAVIIASGIYIVWRESRLAKEA